METSTNTQALVPQFKEKTFKSIPALNKWLRKNSKLKIYLKDFGFDILEIWVHESGEILQCNAHGNIYNGSFLDMDNLDVGQPISMRITSMAELNFKVMANLIPERITKINND